MLAYIKKFVKRLKLPISRTLTPTLSQRERGIGRWLILANILLVFFLILLSNVGILPFEKIEDFGFFAVIFLILALYRPGWSFLFFIGTIALENINLAPESLGIAIRPYQFIGALTILAVLIRLASRRLNFSLPKISWPDKAIIIFAAAGFVSVLGAVDKSLSLKYSIIIFSFAALYFLTRLFVQNLDDVKKILPFFLSSSAVVILYGIWQNVRFMKGFSHFETMPGRPNATFAEADWLGMFLVLVLAVLYSLIYFFYKRKTKGELKASEEIKNRINNSSFQIPLNATLARIQCPIFQRGRREKLLVTNYWLLVTFTYILLILTVSRSAWLGAIVITVVYSSFLVWRIIKGFKSPLNLPFSKGGEIRILRNLTIAIICSIGIVCVFNLTSFELGNRLQSTGSGLQEITVSCKNKEQVKHLEQLQQIEHSKQLEQLEHFSCRHINLEDIEKEKVAGNIVTTIYRDDPNVNIRSEIYHKSWEEIKKHPILGIGWGNINNILGEDERGMGLNSSNIFLEVWLGSGIIGLMALVFVWGNIFYRNFEFRISNFESNSNDRISNEKKEINNSKLSNSEFNQNSKLEIQNLSLRESWKLFLTLSFFAILIPNLFNAGIMLGFLWVWLGMASIEQPNNEKN